MPNTKQGARPKLTVKKDKEGETHEDRREKQRKGLSEALGPKGSARSRVEEMFGGTAAINSGDAGPVMEVSTTIPLPEHADSDNETPSVRDIKDRVEGMFKAIGTDALPETLFPAGNKNNGIEAREFVVAEQLKKLAESRYEDAKANAKAVGCFGDDSKYIPGETIEVYRTANFTFSVQRNKDSNMIDRKQVEELLREIAPTKWPELMKRCEKPKAGATRFIVALR
jgi:hypothetical protein